LKLLLKLAKLLLELLELLCVSHYLLERHWIDHFDCPAFRHCRYS
jgi:hypothetical protein